MMPLIVWNKDYKNCKYDYRHIHSQFFCQIVIVSFTIIEFAIFLFLVSALAILQFDICISLYDFEIEYLKHKVTEF